MLVRGPLEVKSSNAYVCTCCGREVDASCALYLGRAAGQMVRACSMACFKKQVRRIKDEFEQETAQMPHKA